MSNGSLNYGRNISKVKDRNINLRRFFLFSLDFNFKLSYAAALTARVHFQQNLVHDFM